MLGPIRTYFFEREKKRKSGGSLRRSAHYKKGQKNHFGLLVDAALPEDRNEVLAFADRLRKDGHRVKILGFLEGKSEGLNIPFDLVTSADLNRISMVPKSELADTFIQQPFDVLINLSIRRNHKALEYISVLSKAAFRIGPWYHHQPNNPYDLCLDTGSTASLRDWIHELMHTLQKIY